MKFFLNGQPITNLTPKEFDLLYYFARHPKQVFSREQLLDHVWGYEFYGDERTVDVHIKRLRKKVGTSNQPFFHTVWGVGYKFDEVLVNMKFKYIYQQISSHISIIIVAFIVLSLFFAHYVETLVYTNKAEELSEYGKNIMKDLEMRID